MYVRVFFLFKCSCVTKHLGNDNGRSLARIVETVLCSCTCLCVLQTYNTE